MLLTSGYKSEVTHGLLLGLNSFVKAAHRTQKNIYSCLPVYYKECYKGYNEKGKVEGKQWRYGLEHPCFLWEDTTPPSSTCSPTQSSPNAVFGGFCGGFIMWAWLIKSLAIGNSFNLQPFPLPWSSGVGGSRVGARKTESSYPLITWLIPPAINPQA